MQQVVRPKRQDEGAPAPSAPASGRRSRHGLAVVGEEAPAPSLAMILACAAPAMILAAILLVPFLNTAHTIDDTLFLWQARQVLHDPLHPTAINVVWGDRVERLSSIMPSGPIMAYLLVPSVMAQGAEWIAHLVQLGLLWIALAATAGLSLRLGMTPRRATLAAALVVAAPVTLGMAATAMPDVAALAFGALGLERLEAWRTQGRAWRAVAAVLSLAAAILTRSHTMLLVVVGAGLIARDEIVGLLEAIQEPDRRERLRSALSRFSLQPWTRRLLPLLAVPLAVVVVMQVTGDPQRGGGSVVGAMSYFATYHMLDRNLVAYFAHLALVLPLGLAWALIRGWQMPWRVLWFAVPTSTALLALSGHAHYIDYGVPAACLGFLVACDVALDGWRRRDALQIVLVAWLAVGLALVIYVHLPAKFLVPVTPAAAILLARRASTRRAWAALTVTAAAGLLLGVLVLRANAAFADLGRRAAEEEIAPRVAAGQGVWSAGHWGFQWYAEQAGARPLTHDPPYPRPGDTIVASAVGMGEIVERFPGKDLAYSRHGGAWGRSMGGGAGFFSNHWGYLPWKWGAGEMDRFDIWSVR